LTTVLFLLTISCTSKAYLYISNFPYIFSELFNHKY